MPAAPSRPLLFALALLLTASGCTPDPVFRLDAGLTDAEDATDEWFRGRQYVTRTDEGVAVSLAYERTARGRHVLLAEVVNRSGRTITVDPLDFRSLPGDAAPDSVIRAFEDAPARDTVPALDPEEHLLTLDLERERAEAREETRSVFALLAVTADAVADVSEATSGDGRTPEEQAADDLQDAERYARFRARRAAYEAEQRARTDRRAFWAETALRRTTLPPGTEARGRVFFPLREEARYLTVEVATGPAETRFFFWQYRFEP